MLQRFCAAGFMGITTIQNSGYADYPHNEAFYIGVVICRYADNFSDGVFWEIG
jgi:hypothetical protein